MYMYAYSLLCGSLCALVCVCMCVCVCGVSHAKQNFLQHTHAHARRLKTHKLNKTKVQSETHRFSVMQCVAVCCSVLQCVAVCCSVLQCVAVCYSVLQCVGVCCRVL